MRRVAQLVLGVVTGVLAAGSAIAFDPNEGAYEVQPAPRPYRQLPRSIVPSRYYNDAQTVRPVEYAAPAVSSPAASVQAPVAAASPAPQPVAAAAPRYVPAQQPDIVYTPAPSYPAPSYNYSPQPAYAAAPVAAPAVNPQPLPPVASSHYVPPRTTKHADQFSLGVEGFYSHYEEDVGDMKEDGPFGSITASYTHYFTPKFYGMLDLRGSYGVADYESTDGTIDNINQWETENRVLAGYDFVQPNSGNRIKMYAGLGGRYFSDHGKGKSASPSSMYYDRRIFQLYMPVGVTYEFKAAGLTFAPNIELDPLLWGNVSSRLGNIPVASPPPYYNIENRQKSGMGIRAEFMMGQLNERGAGWQFGPFVRYWDIPESDDTTDPNGSVWTEPDNKRLQVGAAFKMLF